jgi:hypothetical protein
MNGNHSGLKALENRVSIATKVFKGKKCLLNLQPLPVYKNDRFVITGGSTTERLAKSSVAGFP